MQFSSSRKFEYKNTFFVSHSNIRSIFGEEMITKFILQPEILNANYLW